VGLGQRSLEIGDLGKLRDLLRKVGIDDPKLLKYEKDVEREVVSESHAVLKKERVSAILPAVKADDRVIYNADRLLTPGVGFVREDLVYAEAGMLAPKPGQRAILKELRGCIEPRHFRALLTTYAIINYENLGDWELASEMLADLIEVHKEQGRHIYNLTRSGYVEGYFLHQLRIMKFESGKGKVWQDRFREFFSKKVRFFDLGIWSNELLTEGMIRAELKKRIVELKIPSVKVYGRGELNVAKVEAACEAFAAEDRGTLVESVERYRICHSPCCCVTVTLRPKAPEPAVKARRRWRSRAG